MNRTLPLAAALVTGFLIGPSRTNAAETVRLDSNESLFAVIAAINMAGYDADLNSPSNSPLRAELRSVLAKENIPVLSEMRSFYKHHQRYDPTEDLSQYISLALSVSGPPDFGWRTRDLDVPPDALALQDFRPLLAQFYTQAHMQSIWRQLQPYFDKEEQRYHAGLISTTTVINSYLRVPSGGYLGRNFRVWIDLLAAPNQVQTRNYGDNAFAIVTHSCQPRSETDAGCVDPPKLFDIRHAFLHYHLDPVVIKWGIALDSKKSLIDFAKGAPALDERYKTDYVLLATECLIKAIEAKLDKRPDSVMAAARQGFILTPVLFELLSTYEQQPQGIRFFLPDMIDAIDPGKETKRLDTVKFDKTRPVTIVRSSRTVAAPQSPSGKMISDADSLLKSRNMDEAKQLYLKSLEARGEPSEHAQAWYGLAKIAVLQNQPENAFKLFEKALGGAPDDWTKAWADVYLGRLSKTREDFDSAAKYYRDALTVRGDAAKEARQAAETEAAALPKK